MVVVMVVCTVAVKVMLFVGVVVIEFVIYRGRQLECDIQILEELSQLQ